MNNKLRILAVETSADQCSAALLIDNTLLERTESKPREHARLLLPMITSLLTEARITLQELEALACSCGPGSFTGIRIGMSVIQGFSIATQKPVVLVSSLRALAQTVYRTHGVSQVLATRDARMQEVFWGLFAVDEAGIMQAKSNETLQSRSSIVLPEGNWALREDNPQAQDVARIANAEFELGRTVMAHQMQPVYLRNTVAQPRSPTP